MSWLQGGRASRGPFEVDERPTLLSLISCLLQSFALPFERVLYKRALARDSNATRRSGPRIEVALLPIDIFNTIVFLLAAALKRCW